MNLPKAIRDQREKRGLTQTELATALNRTQGAVSQWELGKTEPDFESLAAMDELFGQSPGFILALAGYVTAEGLEQAREVVVPDVNTKMGTVANTGDVEKPERVPSPKGHVETEN